MGCTNSKCSVEALAVDHPKKRPIESTKKEAKYCITADNFQETEATDRILLIGPTKSGKTTLWHNFEFIYFQKKINKNDNNLAVKNYLIETIRTLIESIKSNNLNVDGVENVFLLLQNENNYTSDFFNRIDSIWNDTTVQTAFQKFNLNGIYSNEKFFLDNIHRITDENYIPTEEDVLKCYFASKTANESVLKFKIDNDNSSMLIDTCDKNNEGVSYYERFFKDANFLIFVVSISDFDQISTEKGKPSKIIKESIKLFNQTVNSCQLQINTIFLVLNKIDIFFEKLKRIPKKFRETFPNFHGDTNNVDECISFVENQFVEELEPGINKKIEIIKCCAIEQKSVTDLFQKVAKKVVDVSKEKTVKSQPKETGTEIKKNENENKNENKNKNENENQNKSQNENENENQNQNKNQNENQDQNENQKKKVKKVNKINIIEPENNDIKKEEKPQKKNKQTKNESKTTKNDKNEVPNTKENEKTVQKQDEKNKKKASSSNEKKQPNQQIEQIPIKPSKSSGKSSSKNSAKNSARDSGRKGQKNDVKKESKPNKKAANKIEIRYIDTMPEREKREDEISVYEYASGYGTESDSYTEYYDSS